MNTRHSLLRPQKGDPAQALVRASLLAPVASFLARPGKRFRARLVEIGFELAGRAPSRQSRKLELAAQIIEAIHAGALIVDDIQDESRIRRDAPTLHMQYGLPRALNAGNWLYFRALSGLSALELPASLELEAHRDCARILTRAHFGQAIDIGTRIDELPQHAVRAVCERSIELKTGALMGLALRLGAYVGNARPERVARLDQLGIRLGCALQRFDDLGNFILPEGEKRREDLRLRRPSWIWAVAAETSSRASYRGFVSAVRLLPEETALDCWSEEHDFVARVRRDAGARLDSVLRAFGREFGPRAARLMKLGRELESAYGK